MSKEFNLLTVSGNNIEIDNPSSEKYNIIRHCMLENNTKTEEYKKRTNAGAFLQCDQDNYLLIECWAQDYNKIVPFFEMINRKFQEKRAI